LHGAVNEYEVARAVKRYDTRNCAASLLKAPQLFSFSDILAACS